MCNFYGNEKDWFHNNNTNKYLEGKWLAKNAPGVLVLMDYFGKGEHLRVGTWHGLEAAMRCDFVTNVDVIGLATYRSGAQFGVAGVGGTITGTGNATITGIEVHVSKSAKVCFFTGNVRTTINKRSIITPEVKYK